MSKGRGVDVGANGDHCFSLSPIRVGGWGLRKRGAALQRISEPTRRAHEYFAPSNQHLAQLPPPPPPLLIPLGLKGDHYSPPKSL